MKKTSENGSFLVPLAVALLVLLGVTFYSLDMALVFKARNQLQTAADAAVTRAMQLISENPTADEAKIAEIEYLAELSAIDNLDPIATELNLKNWDPDAGDPPVVVTIDPETHHVTAVGEIEVNTWVYDLLSGSEWSNVIGARAEGTRKHLIVAILLDTSQSMDNVIENCRECDDSTIFGDIAFSQAFSRYASFNWNLTTGLSPATATEIPLYLRGDFPDDPVEEEGDGETGDDGSDDGSDDGDGEGDSGRDVGSGDVDEQHVTVCHIPTGNPANRRTLRIGAAALEAHLAHGDTEGDCVATCQDQALCNGLSKLQIMKLAALNFISEYGEQIDSLFAIRFAEDANQIPASEINSLIAGGGTDLGSAIAIAAEKLQQEKVRLGGDAYLQMIILTDGVSGNGEKDESCMVDQSTATAYDRAPYMIQLINQADALRLDPGIRFYVVGIGEESDITIDRFQDRFDNEMVKPIFLRRLANDPAGFADEPFTCPEYSFQEMDEIQPGEYVNANQNTLTPVLVRFGEDLLTRIIK